MADVIVTRGQGCRSDISGPLRQYSLNLQGVLITVIFKPYLYRYLVNVCNSAGDILAKIKTYLYAEGIILDTEQEGVKEAETVFNFVIKRIPDPAFEEFLCSLYEELLPPAVALEVENKLKIAIRTELQNIGRPYIEGPVFIKQPSVEVEGVNHEGSARSDTTDTNSSNTSRRESSSIEVFQTEEDPLTASINTRNQQLQTRNLFNFNKCEVFSGMGLLAAFVLILCFRGPIAEALSPSTTESINVTSTPNDSSDAVQPNITTDTRTWIPNAAEIRTNSTNTPQIPVMANESSVPDKPYNFTNLFEPPEGFVSQITDLESVRYSQFKICQDKAHTTLNMSLSKKVDINGFTLNCSENVKGLDVAGPLSRNDVIVLLQRFSNLEYLSFSGSQICEEMEDNSSEVIVQGEKIFLPHLSQLKFENLTECPDLYRFFSDSVTTHNLSKIVLANVFVNSINQELIENIVTKNSQIESLYFKGSLCDECLPFKKVKSWPRLKHLEIEVTNPTGRKAIEFYKILLKATTDLLYLKSNIQLQENNINLLRRSKQSLVFLDVAVQFNDSRLQFSIKSFKDFPQLRQLHFNLLFSNQSVCRVQQDKVLLTHLKDLVTKSFNIDRISFTSNCRIVTSGGGWRLPCRDFDFDRNGAFVTITIFRLPSCVKSKSKW